MVKIGFIGCHEISWHCLKKICELSKLYGDSVEIVINLDQKESLKHSATTDFTSLSEQYNFNLYNVSDVNENIEFLQQSNLDVLFIIGWHKIVPQSVLNSAKIRLGIHSSLLPKDRGPSPINWQLIRGESEGGVSLFHLTIGVDSGNLVDSKKYSITELDTVKDVYKKATIESLYLLEKNWIDIHKLQPKSIPQEEKLSTLNERRRPKDGLIDWNWDAQKCHNWIRALTKPYPGAFTFWKNQKIFLWGSKLSQITYSRPGEILESGNHIIISTGRGSLEITSLQIENEPFCDAEIFSLSYGLDTGDFFSNTQL